MPCSLVCSSRKLTRPSRLLETGNFSDVRLECGGQSWNLHKAIICNRCVWFRRALTGSYKVRTGGKGGLSRERGTFAMQQEGQLTDCFDRKPRQTL